VCTSVVSRYPCLLFAGVRRARPAPVRPARTKGAHGAPLLGALPTVLLATEAQVLVRPPVGPETLPGLSAAGLLVQQIPHQL